MERNAKKTFFCKLLVYSCLAVMLQSYIYTKSLLYILNKLQRLGA